MTKYLFDTSAWICHFRRPMQDSDAQLQSQIQSILTGEQVVSCGMVIAEVLQGISDREEKSYRDFFGALPCLETLPELYFRAAQLSRMLRDSGNTTPLADCLIAAHALYYDCVLAAADRDFTRFPELKLLLLE